MSEIGSALRALREARRMSLEEVGAKMGGINRGSVRSIEHGNPTADSILRHLEAIGCNMHDLCDELDRQAGRPTTRPDASAGTEDPVLREALMTITKLVQKLDAKG